MHCVGLSGIMPLHGCEDILMVWFISDGEIEISRTSVILCPGHT